MQLISQKIQIINHENTDLTSDFLLRNGTLSAKENIFKKKSLFTYSSVFCLPYHFHISEENVGVCPGQIVYDNV